jgi:hypothetical protein
LTSLDVFHPIRLLKCPIEQLWDLLKGNMETILALSTFALAIATGSMGFVYGKDGCLHQEIGGGI